MTGTVYDGTTLLLPQDPATRAQAAAVLKRFMEMGISLPRL
jgi:hypothetical protein